ncbi:MAG: helix-turn-helix domain-containing protein [Ruminococcus sp.]|nr:helix-turn-helix domain-containing protein [Ruminococcus sp.]
MEVGSQIKKYRTAQNWSQETLAEKAYVSRQTVSNWENEKSYPDIHSLVLLSTIFNISLDELIKGDVEVMKKEIKKEDISTLKKMNWVLTAMMLVTVASAVPLARCLNEIGIVIWGAIYAVTFAYTLKVEKFKKKHNIQTYREIMAFMNGQTLDEIDTHREEGKRGYQKILSAIIAGAVAVGVCVIIDHFI